MAEIALMQSTSRLTTALAHPSSQTPIVKTSSIRVALVHV